MTNRLSPEQIGVTDDLDGYESRLLHTPLHKCYYFADDRTDEFQIVRGDRGMQPEGIFKTWAMPIIPLLDTGKPNVDHAIESWQKELEQKPLSLWESLEGWRAFSAVADRRLQLIFEFRSLPVEPEEAMCELILRLQSAFALSAPFYNLEALIADGRIDKIGNPIDFQSQESEGGKLDATAMILPAAFKDRLGASDGSWNGLSWQQLRNTTESMRADFLKGLDTVGAEQFRLLYKIANLAGVDPVDVLFAANALEFVPTDVGGKSDDMEQSEALATLKTLLADTTPTATSGAIARDMNALIRFLNWIPAVRLEGNFAGLFWSYGAVCDTASQLVSLVQKHPEIAFGEPFATVFNQELAPQLDGLDATSAKGRLMLQLLAEGKFIPEISQRIANAQSKFKTETLETLKWVSQHEALLDISSRSPGYMVGGKSEGLRRAMGLFGEGSVIGGKVLSSEAVKGWVESIPGISKLLVELEATQDTKAKMALGHEISQRIMMSPVPQFILDQIRQSFDPTALLAVRSSSFDEDVDVIGPAPGVYESQVGVNLQDQIEPALKAVVRSFFSEKAIAWRELKGLRHKLFFAVPLQELVIGPGGTMFIRDGEMHLNIASHPSQVNGNLESEVEQFIIPKAGSQKDQQLLASRWINSSAISTILWMANRAEAAAGPCDIEFVVDPKSGKVIILQWRTLHSNTQINTQAHTDQPMTRVFLSHLEDLPDLSNVGLVDLHIAPGTDLDRFQGHFFRWVITNMGKVRQITLSEPVPITSHFANIMGSLGVTLISDRPA